MVDTDGTVATEYGGYNLDNIYLYNKSGKLLSKGDIEALECPHCQMLLRDPCQLIACGDRVCRSCLDNDIMKKNPRVCPVDDEPIEDGQVRTDKGCLKEILRLTAVCGGKDNGCDWSGDIDEAESHVSICNYILVPCPHGCGQSFARSHVNSHTKQCPKKPDEYEMMETILKKLNLLENSSTKQQSENTKLQQKVNSLNEKFIQAQKEIAKLKQEDILKQDHILKLENQLTQLNEELVRIKEGGGVMSDSGYRPMGVDDGSNRGDGGYGSGTYNRSPHMYSASSTNSVGTSSYPSTGGTSSYPSTVSSGYNSSSFSSAGSGYNSSSPPNSYPSSTEDEIRAAIKTLQVDVNTMRPAVNDFTRMQSQLVGYMETVQTVQESVTRHAVSMEEIKLRQDILDVKTTHGIFIWKIPEIGRRYGDAQQRRTLSLYSPPFHTSPHGYRMCIRAYLNGDGSGKGTHISVFFVLMKSEHDNLLSWPFKSPVTFQLLNLDNPSNSITETFMPDIQSPSFQQPKSEMNIASGFPRFAKQGILKDLTFTRGDAIFIRCKVDLSTIEPKE